MRWTLAIIMYFWILWVGIQYPIPSVVRRIVEPFLLSAVAVCSAVAHSSSFVFLEDFRQRRALFLGILVKIADDLLILVTFH